MTDTDPNSNHPVKHGVVGVICHESRLLLIERSQFVKAPGAWCFPGGTIESGESEPDCLVRELQEELSATVQPVRKLWECMTPWNVHLRWWMARMDADEELVADPAEVADFRWMTLAEIKALEPLLTGNRDFLEAHQRGEFAIDGLST